jgi:hydrogenase maturation factor
MDGFVGPVPLLGKQQAPTQQDVLLATYRQLYFNLIPVCTSHALAREELRDDALASGDDVCVADSIAEHAESIALAAMRRLGVEIKLRVNNGQG